MISHINIERWGYNINSKIELIYSSLKVFYYHRAREEPHNEAFLDSSIYMVINLLFFNRFTLFENINHSLFLLHLGY